MVYAVGDVHGEITKLNKLLDAIQRIDPDPQFVFIGDYLDKGENSRAALLRVVALHEEDDRHVFLMGNHEYMWTQVLKGDSTAVDYLTRFGGRTTAADFGDGSIEETARKIQECSSEFFQSLRAYAVYKNYLLVHSGVSPAYFDLGINDVPLHELLFNRYDFIAAQQKICGYEVVIFGHTGFYSPYIDQYKIGIDTAAVYHPAQPLTAFCMDNNRFYNSDGESFTLGADILYCPVIPRVKPPRTIIN